MDYNFVIVVLALVVTTFGVILAVIAIVAITHNKDALAEKATSLIAKIAHDVITIFGKSRHEVPLKDKEKIG